MKKPPKKDTVKRLKSYLNTYQKARKITNEILSFNDTNYEITCALKTLDIWLECVIYDIKSVKRHQEYKAKYAQKSKILAQ